MKKLLMSLMVLSISISSFAGCEQAYTEKIKNIEGRMNPARGVLIANTGGAIITQAVVYSVVGSISVVGAIGVPAIAAGAGSYLTYLAIQKAQLRTASHLIRDAKKGSGEELEDFIKRLSRRANVEVDRQAVIEVILAGNTDNEFCIQDQRTDKYKLLRPHAMLKFVEEKLAL